MAIWGKPRDKADAGPGKAKSARLRTLIWATLAAILCGTFDLAEPIEDSLRTLRNHVRKRPASGEVVVVGVDERSLDTIGAWPWPRSRHADLIDSLNALGARSISFDIVFSRPTSAREDLQLASALARSKRRVTLAVRSEINANTGVENANLLIPALRGHADPASINFHHNFREWVWQLPYRSVVGGTEYPTMAAKLAGVTHARKSGAFLVDYAIDPRTVPTISAVDLLRPGTSRAPSLSTLVRGKDVIIGTTSQSLGDLVVMPGHQAIPGVYLHALGAETLRSGTPRHGGWVPPVLAGLVLAGWSVRRKRLRTALVALAIGAGILIVVPLAFDAQSVALGIFPAIVLLIGLSIGLSWSSLRRSYRTRGTVNLQSGLLNLDALRLNTGGSDCILIAARINNYAQIAAALSTEEENVLVAQVAQRLTIGSSGQALYQGDEGIFAWFVSSDDIEVVGEHLDALHGFFRESLNVTDKQVDLSICFGLDTEGDRSPANRLGSALVACEEAAAEGIKWKAFDPAALVDSSWKLSLLGQLDRAIDSGDFWVAYQPKLDVRSGRIVGAEALARWTHPVKGPIAPVDFILAAEQSDRIERLTRFVLDRSIAAAAAINGAGYPFNIAVNLSTRLIGDPSLPRLVSDLLSRHGLAAHHLTLEVTETAAMGTAGTNLETLVALRDLGVCISIDDYGTGLSTLEYLKKIPATEIKIDQSFVTAVTRSHSDRLMVHSTIQLVHSLGHVVVAEGVETQATLDALKAMGCDYAQGFLIGRPVTLDVIANNLGTSEATTHTQNG